MAVLPPPAHLHNGALELLDTPGAPVRVALVRGSGFGVQGSGSGVWGSGFRVQGSGFRVQGLGYLVLAVVIARVVARVRLPGVRGVRVLPAGFRVQGSGFRVQGAGFRVQGSGCRGQGSGSGYLPEGVQGLLVNKDTHRP